MVLARPLRINVENGWRHITSRGNRGEAIFLDKRDHLKFLDLVGELGERHRVRVHEYVLMSNHYHLLILNWEQIVSAVEEVKGEKWKAFCDRHGDGGRDLALWYGRRYAGLRLWELGERAGGLDYSATSEAIRHFERVKMKRPEIQRAHRRVAQFLNLEM